MTNIYGLVSDWITPEQVSESLDVDVTTVYRWLNTGMLKGFQLGKTWRISEPDVLTFVQEEKHRQERKIAKRVALRDARRTLKRRKDESPQEAWGIRECDYCGLPFVTNEVGNFVFCSPRCEEAFELTR
jgi:excisionase family DNA binding protein